VLVETDTSGSTLAKFDYGPDRLLSMNHISQGRAYYLFDALGSVANLTTTTGGIQARYQYDAYGNYRSTAGSSFNRFAFTGHEKDNETNLYYFKARFYDPETGRFLNQDAYLGDINTPPSLHRYLYAYGNPTVYIDPDGHIVDTIGGAVAGFFWGAGQMVGSMINDVRNGTSQSTSEYLGIWGQNIVAGAEIGASIDVAVLSGGTLAYTGSGALGGAGISALTVSGKGSTTKEFLEDQSDGAAYGAIGGAVFSKLAPVVSKGAQWVGSKIPEPVKEAAGPIATAVADTASKAVNAVSDTIANLGQAVKSGLTSEGKQLATAETRTPAVQKSVTAEVSVGAKAEVQGVGVTQNSTKVQEVAAKGIPDAYEGVRQGSQYLQEMGVSRAERVRYLQSFEPQNMEVRQAGQSEFGIRYFSDPKRAGGQYLFETFPASRSSLAIKPEWSSMSGFRQFQIKPDATIIEGRAAAQGAYLPGGQTQKFILDWRSDLIAP
jgi:RHS repeat-associated protein